MSQLAVLMGIAPFVPPPNVIGCRVHQVPMHPLKRERRTSEDPVRLIKDTILALPADAALSEIIQACGKSRYVIQETAKSLGYEPIKERKSPYDSADALKKKVLAALNDRPERFLPCGRLDSILLGEHLNKSQNTVRRALNRLISEGSDLIEYKGRAIVLKGKHHE